MTSFDVLNRWTGEVQFTAEIDCGEDAPRSLSLGLAVKWAIKNGANLSGADLRGANLIGANLHDADLSCASLHGANLYGANLHGADLSCASLHGANLYGASLSCANLHDASLRGAKGAERVIAQTRILPEGSLIGWKKARLGVIVKLRIPEEARRSHAFGRKCRAEFADVLEIMGAEEAESVHMDGFIYRPGERVTCDEWCEDFSQECAGGIHFFITRQEAEDY